MRGFRPGRGWPRNPAPPDPALVRQRTRAHGQPFGPADLGR